MAAKGGRIDFMFLGPPLPGHWIRYCFHIVKNTLQLLEMRISSKNGFNGNLSSIIIQSFPQLTTLYLSSCELTSEDLSSLRQAKKEGMLPFLKHLDISENELSLSEFACLLMDSRGASRITRRKGAPNPHGKALPPTPWIRHWILDL